MHHIRHGEFRWVTHLIEGRMPQSKFHGFPKYQKQKELSLYKQVLGLWNANMESDIDLVIDWKKNWFCDNET